MCKITYSRKVQTAPFENLCIGLEEEFSINGEKGREEAFRFVRDTVERWIFEAVNNPRRR